MWRFRGKGALVMVAALLLLGDFLWTRGVPPLEADPPEASAESPALYAAAETALPHPADAPVARPAATVPPFLPRAMADAPTARPMAALLPVAARFAAVAAALRPSAHAAPLPVAPRPSMAPAPQEPRIAALEEALRPVVTARVAVLAAPAVRFDAVLPPRPWAPPQGIAYIRWWHSA